MINKNSQVHLNRIVSGFAAFFVFKSSVHYDIYLPIENGLLIYDSSKYTWVPSKFKNKDELVEEFKDKYPIYSNSEIFNQLDWGLEESDVKSLTNVSLLDWK